MSLFKRPSWSQPIQASDGNESDEDDDRDIFSHARPPALIIQESQRQERQREEKLLEKERRRQGKAKEKEGESATSSSKREGLAGVSPSNVKRPRITSEDSARLLGAIGIHSPAALVKSKKYCDDKEEEEVIIYEETTPVESPRNQKSHTDDYHGSRPSDQVDKTIELVDSSDDERNTASNKPNLAAQEDAREQEEESDPELAELQRKARARYAQQGHGTLTPSLGPVNSVADHLDSSTSLAPVFHDATIKILISSTIPNTKPLMVYRKLSQTLREVRTVWCDRQGFSTEFTEKVFLAYRNRRLFNVTTCRSLGLEADAMGNVTYQGDRTKQDVDQVHIEAVTEDIFELMQKKRTQTPQDASLDAEEQSGSRAGEEPESGKYIPILINAKGKEPFKLKVLPDTIVSKIISVAKRRFETPKDQSVYIEFDGERLDPDSKVQDTEIEHHDSLDFYTG